MKTQSKTPHQFVTLAEHFKTKYHVFFFLSQKGEKTYVITLEVYNVKALEVSVLLLTLEVFIYVLFIQVLEMLCV